LTEVERRLNHAASVEADAQIGEGRLLMEEVA